MSTTYDSDPARSTPQPCVTCGLPVIDSDIGWIHISASAGEFAGWQCPPPHMRLATPDALADQMAGQVQLSSPAPALPPTAETEHADSNPSRKPQQRKIVTVPQYQRASPNAAGPEPPQRQPTPTGGAR